MSKIAFDEKELTVQGMYPEEGTWYGGPYMPVQQLSPPASPAENLINYYQKKPVQWIPDILGDCFDITPDCIPDVVACGFAGGYDTFGVKWIPDTSCPDLPSFVEPGFTVLEEIENWKDLPWPDADSWDWKGCAAKYNETLKGDNRLRRGILLSGYFERLISIMGFEGAAMAMIEDPDSVGEFFDALTDLNIKITDHYIDDFGCKAIMIHDDWSAQRSPFFSPDCCMEVIVPCLKRLADHCHERGIFITLHSCGNGLSLIPCMKAAGVDAWQAQDTALDLDAAYAAIDDAFVFETYPSVPEGIRGAELEAYVRGMLERCNKCGRSILEFYDFEPDRGFETRKLAYKIGRELA